MSIFKLSLLMLRLLESVALLLVIAWAAAALWIDAVNPVISSGLLAGGCLLLALLIVVFVRPWRRMVVSLLLLFIIVLGWWLTLQPSNDREWQADVARAPSVVVNGSKITVHNVRNFDYSSETDYSESWETRTYDLDELVGLDLFISYWGPTLYGHTIMSWEFADGRHLAISIETRKEKGEEYSAVRGFFRQFELYYVAADESDVIRLRTNYRGEMVRLYRLSAPPARARALLQNYITDINQLAQKPRWYNALTHNCTTSIWLRIKAIGTENPFDWRLIANGHLIELIYERGQVNTSLPLEELKRHSDITARARASNDGVTFSQRIRQGLPPRADTQ